MSDYMIRVMECPSCRHAITSIAQNLNARATIEIILDNSVKFKREPEVLRNLEK